MILFLNRMTQRCTKTIITKMKMTNSFKQIPLIYKKRYYQRLCVCGKNIIMFNIIYGIQYKIANFYRTWFEM